MPQDPEYFKQYYKDHREERLEYAKKHARKKRRDANRARSWKKRHEALKLLPNTLTEEEWQELLAAADHRCVYCDRHEDEVGPMQKDHIIPVSRGGGTTKDNIQPACKHCNARKATKSHPEAPPGH